MLKKLIKKSLVVTMLTAVVLGSVGCGKKADESAGSKEITVVVTHKDGKENTQTASTDQKYLIGALDEMNLVDKNSGDSGYYVTVDGETADTDKEEWWCLTIDGESALKGFDDTPVEDGKSYELTFTEGF